MSQHCLSFEKMCAAAQALTLPSVNAAAVKGAGGLMLTVVPLLCPVGGTLRVLL
jgi:hypothetical protein